QLANGITLPCTCINNWEIELLIARLKLNKKVEHGIQDLVRPRIFSVDLVDDDDWLQFVLHRLAQNKTRLRLRPVVCIDYQQHAVHHFHDSLDFPAKISVS